MEGEGGGGMVCLQDCQKLPIMEFQAHLMSSKSVLTTFRISCAASLLMFSCVRACVRKESKDCDEIHRKGEQQIALEGFKFDLYVIAYIFKAHQLVASGVAVNCTQ